MRERNIVTLYLGGERTISDIIDLLTDEGIEGATITPSVGMWKGTSEPSQVIEIVGIDTTKGKQLKEKMEQEFSEESVMMKHNKEKVTF